MFTGSHMQTKRILISGAGIAGLSFARILKKFKIPFMWIEKRESLSTDGAGIALPANAMKALRYMGLGEDVEQAAHQVNKIIYTDSTGEVLSEASLLDEPLNEDHFVALQRSQLHEILCKGIDDIIHFGTTIDEMVPIKNGVQVKFNNPKLKQEEFSAVIGADGVNSQVRQLAFPDTALTDLGVTIWRWTCQYPTHDLQPTYMLGLGDIFMAYPIGENEVYCYAHAVDPDNIISKSDHRDALMKQFGQYDGIAKTMLNILPDNQSIISGRLRSVPQPLFTSDRIALIGDAGHACSPMLQQGAACAFEDVVALSELLKHFPVQDALFHYEEFRKQRVNWITASSDGPMKMLINVDSDMLSAIKKKIFDNGPLNVQGWKALLATDPLTDIAVYIAECKQEKSVGMLVSKP